MAAALLATALLLLATVLLLLAIALLLSFRKTPPTEFLGPFWDFTSIFVCLQHLFMRLYYLNHRRLSVDLVFKSFWQDSLVLNPDTDGALRI